VPYREWRMWRHLPGRGLVGNHGTPRAWGPASGETKQLFVTFCLVAWDRGGLVVHGYGER